MENTDLVVDKETNELQLNSFDQIWKLSSLLVKSELFGTQNTNEVATKIITGLEMGISPVRAVRHIDTIDGSPSVSAQLSAAMIQMSEKYDYVIEKVDVEFNDDYDVVDGVAIVSIIENGKELGSAQFTWNEAKAANLTWKDNWESYPRDMLFARAMKRAKKWYCPSIGIGREYMPDELGASEKPTVEVPNEVVDEATKEDGNNTTDVDYEVEEEASKKVQKDINDLEDEKEGVPNEETTSGFDMQTTSTTKAKSEVEDSKGKPTTKGEPTNEAEKQTKPPHPTTVIPEEEPGTSRYKPYAMPGGIEGIEGKVNQIEYELRCKVDYEDVLRGAIQRYWDYWENVKEGEFKERLRDILKTYEEQLQDSPTEKTNTVDNPELDDLKSPTQKIIKEMDTNLSKLEGDDLHEQIQNYREEVSKYSNPAKKVAIGVIENHASRLDDSDVSDEQKSDILRLQKERAAEWESNLSTSQTLLGQKINETQKWKPLHDLIIQLDEKAKKYIDETKDKFGECELVSEMEDQWAKVLAPYRMIQDIREAIVKGDEMDLDRFDTLLEMFTDEIKSWSDEEKAHKAHDIVFNEVERMDNNVDYFNVQNLG